MAVMPILAAEALLHENKKKSVKNATPVGIKAGPLVTPDSQFWTKLTFACKTETLGSLYNHALLILTGSSKSKYHLVHEQKFKDLLSST